MKILHDDELNSICGGVLLIEVDSFGVLTGNGVAAKGGMHAFWALSSAAVREGGLNIESIPTSPPPVLNLITQISTP
ncbi:MAG: hypothetical protein K0Q74_1268 [Gammaproteobacteria bacterium]|jgi:hypothetical protein|nr:hypothetical protein [Gammaproteobacteria bacterium]